MIEGLSFQYGTRAIYIRDDDTPDASDVIARCREIGAIYHEDTERFVVSLRSDIGPELWTERALRQSLDKRSKP